MGQKDRYGVVLDAGSSGTRVYVYKWKNHESARQHASKQELRQLPKIETKKEWALKKKPGVSTFGTKPYQVGEYLAPLLEHAMGKIPKDSIPDTPLFLLATAGMRLLKPRERKLLLEQICQYTRINTKFLLPDCDLHVQVITGETEGLYGWISANYLLGGFDEPENHNHGKGHHTYGFLDMGGASAQIAFAPNVTEAAKHASDLKMLRMRTLDGAPSEYQVFVTTWLGFGMNEARASYVKRLAEESAAPGIKELPDPCLPRGLETTLGGEPNLSKKESRDPVLVGTGMFEECLRRTYPLLQKDFPCLDSPCLLKGIHVPGIDFEVNHFVGVSEFWHTTHEIFGFGEDHPYNFTQYQAKVKAFCSMDWKDIERGIANKRWGKKVDKEKARQVCFKASWLTNIMHNGIGIPRVGIDTQGKHNSTETTGTHEAKEKGVIDPFQAVDKINGVEVSWTLGKIVLYASSQVPPPLEATSTGGALPVGFGTHTKGGTVPPDWQYAESVPTGPKSNSTSGQDGNWSKGIFPERKSRSSSSIILLFLILGLAMFFVMGRERRSRLYRRCGGIVTSTAVKLRLPRILRRGKRSEGPAYELLMEEGGVGIVVNPDDFDLGGLSDEMESLSDDSNGSKSGASGLTLGPSDGKWKRAKPKAKVQSRAGSTGLMIRTDSRERLTISRDVSPSGRRSARPRSPLPRFN